MREAVGGAVPVLAFAHSYGPPDDVEQRLLIARDAGSAGVWINRYGYLSDDKLGRVARCFKAPALRS